jgi:MFS family permease
MNADKTYAVDGISCFENVPEHHDPVEPYFGPELPAGDLLDGRSAIAETLSRSGMATIYHARDLEQANQIVAVKVPHLRLEAEPERWVKARAEERQAGVARPLKLMELFAPGLLRATLVGSGLAFVAVFGLWGATNWTPTLIRALPDLQGMNASELTSRVSYATMLPNVGALAGYLSFGPLADRVGRRWVFALMCVGSLVMLPVTFLTPRTYAQVLLLLPLLGFFNNGIFSGFPIYLPELYPTRIRATGAGFCFNIGRVLAASGPFVTGYLVITLGSFGLAASAVAVVYVVGLLILPFAPEKTQEKDSAQYLCSECATAPCAMPFLAFPQTLRPHGVFTLWTQASHCLRVYRN